MQLVRGMTNEVSNLLGAKAMDKVSHPEGPLPQGAKGWEELSKAGKKEKSRYLILAVFFFPLEPALRLLACVNALLHRDTCSF